MPINRPSTYSLQQKAWSAMVCTGWRPLPSPDVQQDFPRLFPHVKQLNMNARFTWKINLFRGELVQLGIPDKKYTSEYFGK